MGAHWTKGTHACPGHGEPFLWPLAFFSSCTLRIELKQEEISFSILEWQFNSPSIHLAPLLVCQTKAWGTAWEWVTGPPHSQSVSSPSHASVAAVTSPKAWWPQSPWMEQASSGRTMTRTTTTQTGAAIRTALTDIFRGIHQYAFNSYQREEPSPSNCVSRNPRSFLCNSTAPLWGPECSPMHSQTVESEMVYTHNVKKTYFFNFSRLHSLYVVFKTKNGWRMETVGLN